MAESFWATLKTEYYYRRAFTTRDQAYTGVATWIEDFYNRRRIRTSLGGKPPSNTNYTKRPGQQPHKQTVNSLHSAPGHMRGLAHPPARRQAHAMRDEGLLGVGVDRRINRLMADHMALGDRRSV